MLDRDPLAVVVKDDLAYQQPHDALALGERELAQAGAQAGHELIEALGELEIGLGVGHLCVDRLQLGRDRALARAQRGHPPAVQHPS
jgi:hypothetical protein